MAGVTRPQSSQSGSKARESASELFSGTGPPAGPWVTPPGAERSSEIWLVGFFPNPGRLKNKVTAVIATLSDINMAFG